MTALCARISAFAVLAILLIQLNAFAQTGTVRGKVTDENGAPLVGATVVVPEAQNGAVTNDNGLFSISKLAPGGYTLVATYPEKDTLLYDVEVKANKTVNVDLRLRPTTSTEVIEVIANQTGRIDKGEPAPGLTTISSEDIKLIPSFGVPDFANYLQVLPGVVFTGDQGGQLYIRGGTPIQNLVMMDGAVIYNAFHSIGLFSIFDTDYIRQADVYTGGFSARYGGRISSVMDLKTRNGNFRRFSGKVEGNPIMAGALLEGPLFPKKEGKELAGASYLLSVRNSYLDQTSQQLYSYVNDTAGLPFSFTDLYGKLTFGSGANQFSLFGFHQRDQVDYGFPQNIAWQASGGGANFTFLPGNTQMILSGNLAISNYSNELINPDENFPRESSINGFNARLNFAYILNTVDELSYGLQILGFNSSLRFSNSLGLITSREDNNTEFAGYFQYKKVFRKKIVEPNGDFSFKTKFVLEPSVRAHFYNDQGIRLEPRLRTKYNFNKVSLQASWGIYSQNLISAVSDRDVVQLFQGYLAAPREGLADRPLETYLQVATHYVAGVEVEVLPGMKATLEGWYKDFQQVTNINRRRQFPEEDRFIAETGEAYGGDFILKYERRRLYLYGTYGYAKVTRDDGVQTYNPVFDRRHNVNAVANYHFGELRGDKTNTKRGDKWEFGLRWNLGSGFPFTQTQGFFPKINFNDDGAQSEYVTQNPELGILLADDLNGGRLPYYHRLDLMIKRRWLFGEYLMLEVNANAVNVYDRNNIFYFDRVRNARVDQLPIMPLVGARLSW